MAVARLLANRLCIGPARNIGKFLRITSHSSCSCMGISVTPRSHGDRRMLHNLAQTLDHLFIQFFGLGHPRLP